MRFYVFILLIVLVSCHSEKESKFISLKKGDTVMEGYATPDSVFTDTVFYYDAQRHLFRKEQSRNGQTDGVSIDYYNNGYPHAMAYYTNGLKNGKEIFYDSLGRSAYEGFYYYDLGVGPIIFRDTIGDPKRYFFISLQNETLIDINYRKWNGIAPIVKDCVNFTIHDQWTDSTRYQSLFIYLPTPPKLSFDYTVVKNKKEADKDFTDVRKITSDAPFATVLLPIPPEDEAYSVRLDVYDSILNKKSVIYKKIDY